jgi:MFS family permease
MLLLGAELFDELYSGVPSVGASSIQHSFDTSYAATAWVLLLAPGLFMLVVEPLLFLLADRYPRRWFVCGGLLGMSASALVAAASTHPAMLSAAIGVAGVSAASGVALAQATLVDAYPDARERIMARWSLLGMIGDLAAPALMAGLAFASLGWRTGYLIVGIGVGVWALLLLATPFPDPARTAEDGGDDEDIGLRAALMLALRNRSLMLWLFASSLCDLLDEILVVFATLHLRDTLGAGPAAQSAVLAAFVLGGAASLAVLERPMQRIAPLRLLAASGAVCTVVYAAWIAAPSWPLSLVLFALVGAAAAPLYPIVAAQAYAALPGRSGAVHAASHAFSPLVLVLPWLLGWLADVAGTTAALIALIVQPAGLALIAALSMSRHRGAAEPGSSSETGRS